MDIQEISLDDILDIQDILDFQDTILAWRAPFFQANIVCPGSSLDLLAWIACYPGPRGLRTKPRLGSLGIWGPGPRNAHAEILIH